jgi:epoxide hydrolase-like predicted phosphatase
MIKEVKIVKAVIFDVGGVLALGKNSILTEKKFIPSGVHEYVARKLKISMDQYLDSIEANYPLAMEGKLSGELVLRIFSRNMKTTIPKLKKIYLKAYNKNFKQNKKLLRYAYKLKKRGYIIGILSDQWAVSKQVLMPEKIYRNFDLQIVSCDIGLRKPNPKIYDLLVSKLNLLPEEILFIDNQDWNLSTPKAMGIKTIKFQNNRDFFRQVKKYIR